MTIRRSIVLLLAAVLGCQAAPAGDLSSLSASRWKHDLDVLATELPRIHPNPFHAVSRAEWNAAVAQLAAEIPKLKRDQIVVGFMRIVAMIGEGHTTLNPFFRPELRFHQLPIRPYSFSDGLYVRAADSAHAALAGAKIVRIGRLSAEEAYRAVAAVVSHDNDSGARAYVPQFLAVPEILAGTGITSDDRSAVFELEKDGRPFTETLEASGLVEPRDHSMLSGNMETADWTDARRPGNGPAPLWLQNPADLYWSRYLPESRTIYIQYNAVMDKPDDPISAFFPRVIAEAEKSAGNRLVIDVRSNGGGNSFLNRPIIKSLIRSRFDRPGSLFVIIGRATFSAAQNFVNDLTNWTSSIFVGEPTASNPNQYGDHEALRLPESGIVVMVSTLYHQTAGPQDHRKWTAPQIPAELSFAGYRDGIDPSLDAVVRYRSISAALAPGIERGSEDEVARAYKRFRTDEATAWIPTETEVNALGYRLLSERRFDRSIQVFRLNVDSFPDSSNAFDSLGEAYLKAGDHTRAIENYRLSLRKNPNNENARRVLAQLGAASGS